MLRQVLGIRNDPMGNGEFGAPRGSRAHRGIDYHCLPGRSVLSPVVGEVSRHGYAYSDDLSWRIVDVRDEKGFTHRLFYVEPTLAVGAKVTTDTAVGVAQDISERYPGGKMLPHIHYEIRDAYGETVNPSLYAQGQVVR